MDRLKCYLCQDRIEGGIDGFVHHLKYYHAATINSKNGNWQCPHEACFRKFDLFKSLRRHARIEHEQRMEPEEFNIENNNLNEVVFDNRVINDNVNNFGQDFGDNDHGQVAFIDNNDVPVFNLRSSVIRMIGKLQAKSAMTGALLSDVIDESEELLFDVVNSLKLQVTRFFDQRGMQENEDVKELLKIFEFDSPYENLKTLSQQIESLKEYHGYIESEEKPLGKRRDQILDKETGNYLPHEVYETFQYVPIIKVLTLILSNNEVKEAVLAETKSDGDILAGFMDGDQYQNHPFLNRFRAVIRIELYYDELEIVNPCGSKTGIHKLGIFYFRIQNLPPHLNSNNGSTHVLCICYAEDVKKYGFKKILKPFLFDLQKLESNEGITINLKDGEFVLRATVVSFCEDGLAVHDFYGLLGPSANIFCRMCLISRAQLLNGIVMPQQCRTKEVFSQHLQLLRSADNVRQTETETGLRSDCCLHASKYFRIYDNKNFDIVHDILLGIGPMTLKLIINHLAFVENLFSIHYLNGRIIAFSYGILERKNKPSPNLTSANIRNTADHSLGQKAMQMWCFLRIFPFLVSAKVPEGHRHMKLLLQLLRIMEIVFAPKLTRSIIPLLFELIKDFLKYFKELFPNVNYINKFHHMSHYPACILWTGPLRLVWCMGYERKHGEIKDRAQVVNNFRNCPKTLVRVCQCSQSAVWGAGDVKLNSFLCQGGKTLKVSDTLSQVNLNNLNIANNVLVFKTKSVKVNGAIYSVGLYVCLDAKGKENVNLPIFGKICEIIVVGEVHVYLRSIICETLRLDLDLNAYCIQLDKNDSTDFREARDLANYASFCTWKTPISDEKFISLRSIML